MASEFLLSPLVTRFVIGKEYLDCSEGTNVCERILFKYSGIKVSLFKSMAYLAKKKKKSKTFMIIISDLNRIRLSLCS